jgi:hypothetical protein
MHEFERLFHYTTGAQPLELKHLEECSCSAVPHVIGFQYDMCVAGGTRQKEAGMLS